MTKIQSDYALVVEVASALSEHGRLLCEPRVEMTDGHVVITVSVPAIQPTDELSLQTLELHADVQRAVDLCSIRALSVRYGVDPADLMRVLTDGPVVSAQVSDHVHDIDPWPGPGLSLYTRCGRRTSEAVIVGPSAEVTCRRCLVQMAHARERQGG